MPPIAGLHDICAIKSRFIVIIAVFKPKPGARPRGFAAGMSGADDNHFITSSHCLSILLERAKLHCSS